MELFKEREKQICWCVLLLCLALPLIWRANVSLQLVANSVACVTLGALYSVSIVKGGQRSKSTSKDDEVMQMSDAIKFPIQASVALIVLYVLFSNVDNNLLLLIFDSIYSFPTVILGLTVVTLLGASVATLMLVVIVIQTPAYARLTRTATLSIKTSEYVQAIESLGASKMRIILVHLLPNVVGPLLIVASMDIPSVVALEAGLTYLGMGIPPPAPSWGRILQEGFGLIRVAPWIVIAGGIPLIITTLGFTFLGEALRDNLDPKLRRVV